ncbi:FAD-dependent monooxygenase [Agromyces sp. NPDC055661]
MTSPTRIRIVGGGIAGLALAASLDPERFDVTLVEQRGELPDVRTILAMWPEAVDALARIGVAEQLRSISPSIDRFPIRSSTGRSWSELTTPVGVLVARDDLLAALDAAVPASVARVTERVDRVVTEPGELVVGADGVHSTVRRSGWGGRADAALTPFLAVRGVLPESTPAEAMGEYWGRGRLYGVGPHRSGTNWYASFRTDLGPRHVDVAIALDLAREGIEDLAPGLARVLSAADPETSLAQRIWTTPRLRSYVRGRLVLVGDAAHAMTPNLGRGGCEALVDAVTLGRLLGELPVDEALVAYDRERVRPSQRLRAASAALMRVALAERAQPARDGLLGVVSRVAARRARRTRQDAAGPSAAVPS